MINFEGYKNEILKISKDVGHQIAATVCNGQVSIRSCYNTPCSKCIFNDCTAVGCSYKRYKWFAEEYQEPKVDWTKVKRDTPVYVRDDPDKDWFPRYFDEYVDGKVFVFQCGTTSFTRGNVSSVSWKYVKLAEAQNND